MIPLYALRLYGHFRRSLSKGREIMSAMMPLMDFLEDSGKFVQSIKYGCEVIGLRPGGLRAPLQGLDDVQKQSLTRIVATLKEEIGEVIGQSA